MSSSSESSEKGTRSSADLVGRSSPPPNPRTEMGEAASAANQHLNVQHDMSGFYAKRAVTSLPQDIVHPSLPPTELEPGHTIHGERSVTIGAQRGAKQVIWLREQITTKQLRILRTAEYAQRSQKSDSVNTNEC